MTMLKLHRTSIRKVFVISILGAFNPLPMIMSPCLKWKLEEMVCVNGIDPWPLDDIAILLAET